MLLRALRNHPARLRRLALARTSHALSAQLLREAFPELVYHPGTSGNTDVHYQDREIRGAVCCTPTEAMLLHHAARLCDPAAALEIGSYVGWSTAHIAGGLRRGALTCVDPFLETGEGGADAGARAHARFRQNLERAGLATKVRLVREKSPEALPALSAGVRWDFVLIDGWHLSGAPLRDVLGVLPYLAERPVLLLHDLWIADVRDAFTHLVACGWGCHVFDTANYLALLWPFEAPRWLPELQRIADDPAFVLTAARGRRFLHGLGADSIDTIRLAAGRSAA